jgi:hypothetical protein
MSEKVKSLVGQDFEPSLGLAWRNLVNNRIVMSRTGDSPSSINRWIDVPFSCYIPSRRISFQVTDEGTFSSDNRFAKILK